MTSTRFIRWTCNACKSQEETTTDRQPEGWAGYGFTATGTPAGEMLEVGHLCAACLTKVYDAMAAAVPACSCGADATSLNPAEVVVHRPDGCTIERAEGTR